MIADILTMLLGVVGLCLAVVIVYATYVAIRVDHRKRIKK